MKRYRRKPEIIKAQQWHKGDEPLPGMKPGPIPEPGVFYVNVAIIGWRRVCDGDWVAPGGSGLSILIRPDAFEQLYEPVEEP